jgi:hypothetical protein
MVREVEQFRWKGRPQVNQVVVSTDDGHYLVSYGKVVAAKGVDGVYLSRHWDYSRTTSKFVVRFLGCENSKEVREHIKSGRYKVVEDFKEIGGL